MKSFVKMTLATLAGLFIFGIVAFFLFFGMIGAVSALGETQPVMPEQTEKVLMRSPWKTALWVMKRRGLNP